MPVPEQLPISHYRGDSLGVAVRLFTDAEKTIPADLDAASVLAQVKSKATDPDPLELFDVDATDNAITLTLTPEQTTSLPNSTVWDVQVDWNSDGVSVQTVVRGSLKLTQDVTR
jgi:hypothetical protein